MFISGSPQSVLCFPVGPDLAPIAQRDLAQCLELLPHTSSQGRGIPTLSNAPSSLLRPELSLMLLPAWQEGRLGSSEGHSGDLLSLLPSLS